MYLKQLRLWNFRKFGCDLPLDAGNPNITVNFVKGINLLVGQNDSGKSAIVDAIKLVTYTHSGEWIKLEHEDFYSNQNKLKIELLFDELNDEEGKNFIEWLSWIGEGEALRPHLCLFLEAERVGDRILPFDIKAGTDRDGRTLSAEAKAYLKVTYLRPLRDAKSELTPKRNSRLSQILLSHEAFEPGLREHEFVSSVKGLNKGIKNYFEGLNPDDTQHLDQRGLQLKSRIDHYLEKFANKKSKFSMNDSSLRAILESLCLLFHDGINLGLGSHNILVIASELLHLQKN
ncbi:hypothetical protein GCM10023093_21820 [Nemorincola caseinilytica]|uniref:Rad50/SbcC-type AAA domain-containing protein n=1 Tax=Nemorincola caseinilytica TaxID=2054315 RepID=A0ABP8NIF4_9BACT